MADEVEDRRQDDELFRRLLTERLPRHAPPAHLRAAIVNAVDREAPKRRWGMLWMPPAAAAAAMALITLLWVAPSLQTTASNDPIRLLARALISEHARTIFWGESRPDVVPAVLPRAMEESGVALSWVFTGDDAIRLVNAQATYLEGRRGIELAYRDADGHTVTYLVVPAGTLALPERGRVQIDRWRPLIRTEAGFSFIIWKQRDLLCLLVSDLVSDDDLAKLKEYFVKVRSSTEPYAVY
jgi:hypothetical protein